MTTKKRHHKEEEKKERIEEPEPQKFVQPKPAEDKDQTDEEILEMLGEPEPAEIKEKEPPTTIQFHDRIKTIDISGKEEMREPPEIQPMESELESILVYLHNIC